MSWVGVGMKSIGARKTGVQGRGSAALAESRALVVSYPEPVISQSTERARLLVNWLGLSLNDLYEYSNHSVSIPQFFRILRRKQRPSSFERKALVHALCKGLQSRSEALFEGSGLAQERNLFRAYSGLDPCCIPREGGVR